MKPKRYFVYLTDVNLLLTKVYIYFTICSLNLTVKKLFIQKDKRSQHRYLIVKRSETKKFFGWYKIFIWPSIWFFWWLNSFKKLNLMKDILSCSNFNGNFTDIAKYDLKTVAYTITNNEVISKTKCSISKTQHLSLTCYFFHQVQK